MAIQGQLRIGNRKYEVLECSYEFSQITDETGKPTTRTRGGSITWVMPTTSDDDQFFYLWMFNKVQTHDGEFNFCVFTSRNRTSYKTVRFKNAYCVDLKDYFNNNDSKLMYTTVTICAEVITVGAGGEAKFTNEWGNNALL